MARSKYKYVVMRVSKPRNVITWWGSSTEGTFNSENDPVEILTLAQAKRALKEAKLNWPQFEYKIAEISLNYVY